MALYINVPEPLPLDHFNYIILTLLYAIQTHMLTKIYMDACSSHFYRISSQKFCLYVLFPLFELCVQNIVIFLISLLYNNFCSVHIKAFLAVTEILTAPRIFNLHSLSANTGIFPYRAHVKQTYAL